MQINPTKLRENKIHAEADHAKKKAAIGQVYIYKGGDVFEFIDIKDVPFYDSTIGGVIGEIRTDSKALTDEIAKIGQALTDSLNALQGELKALNERVKDLENGKFKILSFNQKEV